MYYTYILYSLKSKVLYKGYTENMESRLEFHNEGKVNYTSKHRPWIILHVESFNSKSEAMDRERYFKSGFGREWIKNNIKIP